MIITETFKNDGKDISTLLQEYVCLILKYKDENNIPVRSNLEEVNGILL